MRHPPRSPATDAGVRVPRPILVLTASMAAMSFAERAPRASRRESCTRSCGVRPLRITPACGVLGAVSPQAARHGCSSSDQVERVVRWRGELAGSGVRILGFVRAEPARLDEDLEGLGHQALLAQLLRSPGGEGRDPWCMSSQFTSGRLLSVRACSSPTPTSAAPLTWSRQHTVPCLGEKAKVEVWEVGSVASRKSRCRNVRAPYSWLADYPERADSNSVHS